MEYLIALTILLTTTATAHRLSRVRLFETRRQLLLTYAIVVTVGVAWDTISVIRGHWQIFPEQTLGLTIGVLPVEEYLFILIVPYFILTVYRIVRERLKNS